jgi:hypothetical protein
MNRPWEEDAFSVEEIREYIRKLSDEDLLPARYMTHQKLRRENRRARCF